MATGIASVHRFNICSVPFWTMLFFLQVTLGLTAIVIPSIKAAILIPSVFVLFILLYIWPLTAFALLLITVASYDLILLQFGKLDIRPNDIAVIFGLFALIFQWIRRNRIEIDVRSLDIPLLLLWFWVFLSVFWTPEPEMGIFHFCKISAATLIYFIMFHLIKDPQALRKAVVIWFLAGVFWAMAGVYTICFLGIPAAEKHTIIQGTLPHLGKTVRASTFFGGPNDYAFVLSITILITVILYYIASSPGKKILSALGIVMMLVVILGTFSRKSWIGLFLSFLVIGLKNRRILLMCVFFALASVAVLLWAGAGGFSEALLNRAESFLLTPEVSISERYIAWGVAKELFSVHPIIGNGVGSFFVLAPQLGSPLNIPHNLYWYLLSEYGLVGISLYGIFVFNMVVCLYRLLKATSDPVQQVFCYVLLAVIASVLFQSGFKTIGLTEPIFWIFWGFCSAFVRIHASAVNNREDERQEVHKR